MKKQKQITEKKRVSLRATLNTVIAAAWIIPIGVFTWFIFFNYQNAYAERSDSLLKNAVEVSGILAVTDIDEAITKLQKPTYEGEWERGYAAYARGSKSRSAYLVSLKASLISKYYMDNQITRYAFYLEDDKNPTCYAGKAGYSYTNFLTHVQPVVMELAEKDSNYAEVHVIDNQIYVMRNIYTVNDYRRYGTLVLGLDKNAIFDELPLERPEDVRICFFGDEECLALDDTDDRNAETYSFLRLNSESATGQSQILSLESGSDRGYAYTANTDNYMLSLFYITPASEALCRT